MGNKRTYDWSDELKAALVADDDFNDIEYVALDKAPEVAAEGSTGYLLLPLLHTLAYARMLGGFLRPGEFALAKKWAKYSQMRKAPVSLNGANIG